MSDKNKLLVLGILSGILYLGLFFIFSFLYYFSYAEAYIFHFSTLAIIFTLILIYIRGFNIIKTTDLKISIKTIIVWAIIFNTILLFVLPLFIHTDLCVYIGRARIHSIFNENSYLTSYSQFANDPLFADLSNKWAINTNIYGPLFTLIGWAITALAKNNLFLNFILFKSLFITLNILTIWIIYKITSSTKAAYLYAFNPFLLYEIALKAHLDVIHIFLVLLACLFYYRNSKPTNFLIGWLLLWLSVYIKYVTIIFVPIYFLITLKYLPKIKSKLFYALACALTFFGLTTLLFRPFWEGPIIFQRLFDLSQEFNPFFTSFGLIIFIIIFNLFNFPNFFYLGKIASRLAFIISYLAILVKIIFKKITDKDDLLFYFCAVAGIFLLTFFTRFMPWYNTILVALLIVYLGKRKIFQYNYLIYIISIYSLFYYTILR